MNEADTLESRHLGEPQLSVLTPKSKDPCIKSQFHVAFLGKGSRGNGTGECTHSRDTLANNRPWRPQPEPAELKCMKAPPAQAMGTAFLTLPWLPLFLSRRKEKASILFPFLPFMDTTVEGLA